jgi:hypothetical protein
MAKQAALKAPSSPSKTDMDYQAEDDHRTLQRAAEVTADPDRMQRVAKHHLKVTKDLGRMSAMLGQSADQDKRAGMKPPKQKPLQKRKSPRPYVTKRGIARR